MQASETHAILVEPNLADYDSIVRSFSWEQERNRLTGLPGNQGLNIAHEAIDRHATGALKDHTAIRWIRRDRSGQDFTYHNLYELTNKFANVLTMLGVNKGDTVFTFMGRIPELYISALGTLKKTAIFCPLFSVFGPEPVKQRLTKGNAKVLVTTMDLFEKKIRPLLEQLPTLQHVLIADAENDLNDKVSSLPVLLSKASPVFTIPATRPDDAALLHFTSGTTGMPKGALHVHGAVLTHKVTGRLVLDFHPNDIYWCTADPGWVTGTSYGIISPLVNGVTNIVDEEEFDAARWYSILEEQKVNIWYTAPTAIRRLMRMNIRPRKQYNLEHLRLILSVGEPLHAEAARWGEETFGIPVLDNWWQTETVNFGLLAFDQIANNAATLQHMSGGQLHVPVVIRMSCGIGRQLAAQHSHSWEPLFAHIPGLKVLSVGTHEDARGMLSAALQDPDPVIIFEYTAMLNLEGAVSAETGIVNMSHAKVRREGKDISIITYGSGVYKSLEAATELAAVGIEAEVVDLRVLRPLDEETMSR